MNQHSIQTLIWIGIGSGIFVVFLSTLNWRRSVYAALILVLFEGAIRKWILPQASELIYFLKDAILSGAYLRFYLFPELSVRARILRAPYSLIIITCIFVVLVGALNTNIGSIILATYGIKIYLWYIPLAFMMPYLFKNETDMASKLFYYSLLAIPICLLGVLQFFSPHDSFLNTYARSAMEGAEHIATFGDEHLTVRITGTFSYISGHSTFVIIFFSLCLALLTGIQDRRRWILLLASLPLIFGNSMMTGSRAAVFSLLLILIAFTAVGSIYQMGKRSALPMVMIGVGILSLVTMSIFRNAAQTFEGRMKGADDGSIHRILYPVSSVIAAAKDDNVTLNGYGIGMSHPASATMRAVLNITPPKKYCPTYDSETGQVLAELGWPGFLVWYFLRSYIVFDCWNTFRKCRPSIFRSVCLAIFCFQLLSLPGSVVLNHIANVFVFAGWGICLTSRLETKIPMQNQSTKQNMNSIVHTSS